MGLQATNPKINNHQPTDDRGNQINSSNIKMKITADGTYQIIAERGIFHAVSVVAPIEGGTIYFIDNDDAEIDSLPHSSDVKQPCAYQGTMDYGSEYHENGVKMVVENIDGGLLKPLAFDENA